MHYQLALLPSRMRDHVTELDPSRLPPLSDKPHRSLTDEQQVLVDFNHFRITVRLHR